MAKRLAYAFGPTVYSIEGGRIDITLYIEDEIMIDGILSGTFRGLSPESRVKQWICSICSSDFEECEHIIGQIYDGKLCNVERDIEFTGQSIVTNPLDPRCKIEDFLIITKNGATQYTWHGFKPNRAVHRFRHIQKAITKKYIPQKVGHYFANQFSDKLLSVQQYDT